MSDDRIYGATYAPFGEDLTRCIAEVFDRQLPSHQCLRKRGHGPGKMYCKQHAAQCERERERDDD